MPGARQLSTKLHLLPAVLLLCLAVNIPAAQQDDLISFEISGTMRTDEGTPVPNSSIELTYIKLVVEEDGTPSSTDGRLVVQTDEEGYYSFKFNLDPDWTDFLLRVGTLSIDSFRYALPNERSVTDAIRNAISNGVFKLEVNWVINSRPNWQSELEEIQKYGAESDKGKLIRLRGMPAQIKPFTLPDGRRGEIWFYYADGMAIRFVENKRDKDFHFKPRPR
jgi:hypothetical protein